MARLTKRTVDAAKPAARDYLIWDDELSGFGLRVWPSGRKVYVVQFRMRGERRLFRRKLGTHGPMTPEQARTKALRWLGQVQSGDNPADRLDADRNALTVAALCDRYMVDARAGNVRTRRGEPKKASTLAIDVGRIERHIKPRLGRKRARELTRLDAESFLVAVETGATRDDLRTEAGRRVIVTGGPATARRTVELLGAVMSYAVRLGIRGDNPVAGIRYRPTTRRERYLSPDEYKALGDALKASVKAGESRTAAAMIRALALTGCRPGEIAALRWQEIDSHHSCLRLTDTKTGASVRPIGSAALEHLRSMPAVKGNPYVFPGERAGDHYRSLGKRARRIFKRAGLEGVTPHTLRHSFASVAAELGYSRPVIGALLGHARVGVTDTYIHVDAVLRGAVDRIAAEIEARIEGKARPRGKVVPIRGRRRRQS